VESIRREIMAEIDKAETRILTEYAKHRTEHEAEEAVKASRWRWAVTTVMTGLGTLFAIVWAVSHAS
jgi:hypothetical protein